MKYHFWDMDQMIINGDCDVSWKAVLIATGRADPSQQELVDRFYVDYEQGMLDPDAYVEFQFAEFRGHPVEHVRELAQANFDDRVRARIYAQAKAMIRKQLAAGDLVCLLTATNNQIASPLQRYLGIPEMVATELEIAAGVFSGRLSGAYCCAEGKLSLLSEFCGSREIDLADVHGYGDSLCELHVLEAVGHPVAVNPALRVRERALKKKWAIINFTEVISHIN